MVTCDPLPSQGIQRGSVPSSSTARQRSQPCGQRLGEGFTSGQPDPSPHCGQQDTMMLYKISPTHLLAAPFKRWELQQQYSKIFSIFLIISEKFIKGYYLRRIDSFGGANAFFESACRNSDDCRELCEVWAEMCVWKSELAHKICGYMLKM